MLGVIACRASCRNFRIADYTPETRTRSICSAGCEDIVEHYLNKIEPNGFKGMIVTFDRESCLLYKAELDKLLPEEVSEVVMSVQSADKKEHPEYAAFDRTRDQEEILLDRFRIQVTRMGVEVVDPRERLFRRRQIFGPLAPCFRREWRGSFQVFVKTLKRLFQKHADDNSCQRNDDFYRDLRGGHQSGW